ncbi:DEAD/DEAH box helicase [Candidatus Binatia bacterium]|nr:DEAD/DEAH box helicase [Candidatus Binatia bacterium]
MSSLGQALALTPEVRDGLTDALAAFGRRTSERGLRYAREGRVENIVLREGTVEAVVQGEAPYRVRWQRTERGERRVWIAQCSCPVGIFCKHAFAVASLLLGDASPAAGDDPGAVRRVVPEDGWTSDLERHGGATAEVVRPGPPPIPTRVAPAASLPSRERSDIEAFVVLRESRNSWERRNAADALLRRVGLAYDTVHRVVASAKLDTADPDVRCWRLATELAHAAGREHVPRVLAPFLDRPDLEQRVVERQHARLRQELLGWVGKGRAAPSPRSLRAVASLQSWKGDLVTLDIELHVATSRGEHARTTSQLRQLHGEVRDDPRLLPPEQTELLAIVVDHLSSPYADAGGWGDGVALPPAALRLFLDRATRAGLVTWSTDLDPEIAHRGRLTPGAPLRLAAGTANVAPSCVSRAGKTVLELCFTWPDGRAVPFDDALLVQGEEVWRGGRAAGVVIADGELAFIGSAPPPALIERFRTTGGLPLRDDERVPLVTQLAARWPHLRATLDAHTRVVPVAPVVTLDLREDDWLQMRLLARRSIATEATDADMPPAGDVVPRATTAGVLTAAATTAGDAALAVDGFEYGTDGSWQRIALPADPSLPALPLGAAGVAPSDASADDGRPSAAVELHAREAAASEPAATAIAAGDRHAALDGDPWLEIPDPARVASVVDWLGVTGAGAADRRGTSGGPPPWPDRDTGFWIRLTSKRIPAFFSEWERRPLGVTYLGNERARRLLGPSARTLPKVRVLASGVDFLAVSAAWQTEAAGLTLEEIAALRRATTRFVRLPSGWARKPDEEPDTVERALADLGVEAGAGEQRLTLWQLAGAQASSLDALATVGADAETLHAVHELRERVKNFAGLPHVLPPRTLKAKLRPYQRRGLDFLAFAGDLGGGAILADDMGLGKTVQTLAWLELLRRREPDGGPALVVCPASVVHNWRREAERFVPSLRVLVLERGSERHALRAELAQHDLVITNYALLRRDAAAWRETKLRAAIFDEAQNVKNPDAAVTQAARAVDARYRLALTGTPLENRPLDLFSIASVVCPGYLGTRAQFVEHFDHPELPPARRVLLAAKLRPILLRRLKRDVAADLPERIEEQRDCELTPGQRRLYLAELAKSRDLVERLQDEPDGLKKNRITILAALTRLRQICCHPALVGGKPELGAGKIEALFEVLEPLLAEGHKVLVFSQFVAMLRILEGALVARGMAHHVLTGETVHRERVLQRFADDPRPAVFLLSLKAGGTGLNLTAASYVVLFDPWWNPAVEAQAIDRSHRIGQDRTVIAYRLIARGTIEEKIAELQQRKASLVRELLGDGGSARALTRADLEYLLAPVDPD